MKWNVSNLITAYQVSLVDDHGIVTTLGGIKSPFGSSYEMYFKSREQAQKVADALNMNAKAEQCIHMLREHLYGRKDKE